MKTIVGGLALVMGVGLAFVERGDAARGRTASDFPPGCVIPVSVAPAFLPRADLIVENRLAQPIRVRLEGRPGSGLAAADLGMIGAQQQRTFTHALPAGRNTLIAEEGGSGRARRQVLVVKNHGVDTCGRRSLLRIE